MTNKELTDLLTGLAKDRDAVRSARDALRHQLTALKSDDRLKRRLTPEGQREQARELRQAAIERHRDKVARAKAAEQLVAGITPERAREAARRRACLVPTPTDAELGPYALDGEKRLARQNAAILNELRTLNLRETLRGAAPAELAERVQAAVASGTEAGAAEAELIRREAATRSDLGVHRVTIARCIEAVAMPTPDAEAAELAAKVVAVAGAIERTYHELEHATPAGDENDVTVANRSMQLIEEIGHEAFRDSVRERAQAESAAVKQTADTMLRAAVLEEIKTEGEA